MFRSGQRAGLAATRYLRLSVCRKAMFERWLLVSVLLRQGVLLVCSCRNWRCLLRKNIAFATTMHFLHMRAIEFVQYRTYPRRDGQLVA